MYSNEAPHAASCSYLHAVAGRRGERGSLEVPQKAKIKQPQMADTRIEVPEVRGARRMQLPWQRQLPP